MEVEMESKKANWAILGGIPLPIVNSNAFKNNEIKLAKVRPKLVVDVPVNEDEKRVKVSKIPIVLKYLKNNWNWHSKNGLEKTSSAGNGKKKEPQNTAEIDTRDWSRYRRFQSALRNAANAERQQNGQNAMETEEDAAALEILEDQNRIRRLRKDLVKEEIERNEAKMREGPSTSKAASSNGDNAELSAKECGKQEMEAPKCSKIVSMAARAMEEDEEMEKEISVGQKQCSSSSISPTSMMTIRNGGGRMRRMRMDEDDEEMDGQNGDEKDQRGPHSPPPAKLGRNC